MIWRFATASLVAASVALVAWMYVRDRAGYSPPQAERAQAGLDAERVLTALGPSRACRGHCSVDLVRRIAPGQWLVRFRAPTWQRCFVVNVHAFAYRPQSGLSGVRPSGCEEDVLARARPRYRAM
jgi:hypothetical protein